MNSQTIEQPTGLLEIQLENAARTFAYPRTPDIAGHVKQQLATTPAQSGSRPRRLTWTITLASMAMVLLLTLMSVQTTVVEILRTGVVRIFLTEPVATTTPLLTVTPTASAEATTNASPQPAQTIPRPSATPISSVLNSARETTETQAQVNLPIHLPIRPREGPPDSQSTSDLACCSTPKY